MPKSPNDLLGGRLSIHRSSDRYKVQDVCQQLIVLGGGGQRWRWAVVLVLVQENLLPPPDGRQQVAGGGDPALVLATVELSPLDGP